MVLTGVGLGLVAVWFAVLVGITIVVCFGLLLADLYVLVVVICWCAVLICGFIVCNFYV